MLRKIGAVLCSAVILFAAIVKILEYFDVTPSFLDSRFGTLVQANVSVPTVVILTLSGSAIGYFLACLHHPLRLKIVSARYGYGARTTDVTTFVRKQVKNDRVSFIANIDTLGSDPSFGDVKNLEVTYTLGKAQTKKTFQEYSRVELPE
jgi:hypothetical protein